MSKKHIYRNLEEIIKRLKQDAARIKKAETEFELERAYLDQLYESVQEAIVMCDEQGVVQRINSEFTKMFGYPRKETIGKPIKREMVYNMVRKWVIDREENDPNLG